MVTTDGRIEELEAELRRRERELIEARSALALREEQFHLIAQNVREVLFLRDPHLQKILYVNPLFEEYWQVSAQDLYEDPAALMRAIVPEDRAHVVELRRLQHETGVPIRCEYRLEVGGGPQRWISARSFPIRDEAGQVRYVVGLAEDITHRKQREESQEVRLHQIVETAFEGILTLDAAGVVTFANARLEQILGYPRGTLVGNPATVLLAPGDGAAFRARLARRAAGVSEELEVSILRKDGTLVDARMAVSPLNEGGVFVGALAMVNDVTDRNLSERQLRSSLAEKEVLLREVHHRVKNNLQVVSSLLSLQANTVQDVAARVALEESRERIQSIALAHEFLYRSDHLAQVDFHAYLKKLVAVLAAPFARPEVSIDLQLGEGRLELPIDVTVPCGLLINELLTNALRHAFPSGSPGHVTISCTQEGEACVLCVIDDGVGVSPGAVGGQPQTLGLRLVSSLVRQLGGALEVRVANGSSFCIRFPLAGAASPARSPEPAR